MTSRLLDCVIACANQGPAKFTDEVASSAQEGQSFVLRNREQVVAVDSGNHWKVFDLQNS